jgi:hypothetical protein
MTTPTDPRVRHDESLQHVRLRLAAIEKRVREAIAQRRTSDPEPTDLFRGLHMSAARIDDVLDSGAPSIDAVEARADVAAIEEWADGIASAGAQLRLRHLASAFDIDAIETDMLLLALAPDVDPRFERLYGYLNDDVTRRRLTVALALQLNGLSPFDAAQRNRLVAAGRLVSRGLLAIEDAERPFLARSLRVPDRVTAFLLGDDGSDEALVEAIDSLAPDLSAASAALARGIAAGSRLAYVHERAGSSGRTTALASVAFTALGSLAVNLSRLANARAAELVEAARRAVVEARLRSAVLVAGPLDTLIDRSATEAIAVIAESGWPAVLYGTKTWEAQWSDTVPLQVEAEVPDADQRARLWTLELESRTDALDGVDDLVSATRAFHLHQAEIGRAVKSALLLATSESADLAPRHLQAGARLQNAAGLEQRATRIEPSAQWEDLVVPADVARQLRELAGRARNRDQVLHEWRMGGRSTRGAGITALFAGESGTGKTLSAEVIARELGLDLYVIDLSTVVDKYIGETEKNLDRIFSEADRINGVLLFDEADAIFGKRSEVRDARDRYANVEVAYLLQRMERFDGLAVLTTNLRANIDDSFTRRLDVLVDFPEPEADARLALWRLHLPGHLPQDDDIDLRFLAERFDMSGGNIRNVCLTAAFLAAADGQLVGMRHLVQATGREYRKLGRLMLEVEFGRYYGMLPSTSDLVAARSATSNGHAT